MNEKKFEFWLTVKNWKDNAITRHLFKNNMSPAEFARVTGLSQSSLSNLCRLKPEQFSTTGKAFNKILQILHKLDLDYVIKEDKQ